MRLRHVAGAILLFALAVVGSRVCSAVLAWWRIESAIDQAILDVQFSPERRAAAAIGQALPDLRPILHHQIAQLAGPDRPGFSPDDLRVEPEGDHLNVSLRWRTTVDLIAYRVPLTFKVSRKVPQRSRLANG